MATISTHNGSSLSREHNIRDPRYQAKDGHIHADRPHETWIDEPVRDAYERIFGEAVREYNEHQKRADRQISDYYRQIVDDKQKHPAYEMIIGVYKGSDEHGCDKQTGYSIMREFVDTWSERNPHLELIGAYYHDDEDGEPHVHLDYIPVADGYKRGLSVQNGLNKALEQQGFIGKSIKQTPQIQWEARENAVLEEICRAHGLEIEHPKDMDFHRETNRYKREMDALERDRQEYQTTEIDPLKRERGKLTRQIDKLTAELERTRQERDTAQQELKRVIDQKTTASAIKVPSALSKLFGQSTDTITVDREAYHELMSLGRQISNDLSKTEKLHADMTNYQAHYDKAKALESQARSDRKLAKQELADAKELREHADAYIEQGIEQRAQQKFDDFMHENFDSVPHGRAERLEQFVSTIQNAQGTRLIDSFNRQEQERKRSLEHSWGMHL